MAAAAILKNHKSRCLGNGLCERSLRNLAWWCSSTLLTRATVKNVKFLKSQMAAAAVFKKLKLTISQPRFERFRRNFGSVVQFDILHRSDR